MLHDRSRVGTERAHADDRVLGIRVHVHHGRQVETDAQAGQTRAHRRRDLGGQARVAGGPEREVARVAAAGARVEARHVAAFLIDRHHQLGMLRVERGGQLGDLFVRLHVAGEQHDPSQPLRRPPPDPAGRDGALEPRKDAAQRNHMDKAQSVSRMIAENPQLAELWARGSKVGVAQLNEAERVQFVNFLTYVLRIWEELFLQHQRGLIDEDCAGCLRSDHAGSH